MSEAKIEAFKATTEVVKACMEKSPLDITSSLVQQGVSEFAQSLYDRFSEISEDAYDD